LVIGEVGDTVLTEPLPAPIGFIAFDLDLYSSTVSALKILCRSDAQLLRRVALYFDDVDDVYNHRWAGELLAIHEFNETSAAVKIDRWRGLSFNRPFPNAMWLPRMYVAHDIAGISRVKIERRPARRPLAP
jgi:hypothetical protein